MTLRHRLLGRSSLTTRSLLLRTGAALALVAFLVPSASAHGQRDGESAARSAAARIDSRAELVALLEQARAGHAVPAIAAAIIDRGGVLASAAIGVREAGTDRAVTDDDLFHVGSTTKSMTATLLGVLVDRGVLSWETRMFEVLPELADGADPGYAEVTLRHLLSHTAGLRDAWSAAEWADVPYDPEADSDELRLATAREVLAVAPLGPVGEVWEYANIGYGIAASMAVRATGRPWEELMQQEVFEPLSITTAGLGWPATPENPDQPWGHVVWDEPADDLIDGLRIWPPGHPHRIPVAIAPAGDFHMSVHDFGLWVYSHLRGLHGEDTLVTAATMRQMHEPLLEGYALGWNVVDGVESLPDVEQHQHLGSGGTFTAIEAVFPTLDLAVVVVHNGGSNVAALSRVLYPIAQSFAGSG